MLQLFAHTSDKVQGIFLKKKRTVSKESQKNASDTEL